MAHDAASPPTLRQLADRWGDARGAAKPSPATLRAQRADLVVVGELLAGAMGRAGADDPLAALNPGDLTHESLETVFARHAATHAASSVLRARSTWKSFLTWLRTTGTLVDNPLDHVQGPRRPGANPKALDDRDLDRVLAVARSYIPPRERKAPFVELDRALAAVLFGGGLRAAEVVGLTVGSLRRSDEDLAALRFAGKRDKYRTVPLAPEMAADLSVYEAERTRRFGRPLARDPLFLGPKGTPLSYEQLSYRVEQWFRQAGVDGSTHVARHTYATALTANGVHISEVRDLLGHADIQTTQIYEKTSAARLREAVLANPLRRRFGAAD